MRGDGASVRELNAVLEGTAFLKPYGLSVQSCSDGECVLHVAFAPAMERPGGIVSGMTLMGAADVGMWLAIMTARSGLLAHHVLTYVRASE